MGRLKREDDFWQYFFYFPGDVTLIHPGGVWYWVECNVCYSEIGEQQPQEKAIAVWNTRVPSAQEGVVLNGSVGIPLEEAKHIQEFLEAHDDEGPIHAGWQSKNFSIASESWWKLLKNTRRLHA
jgi:hypothetical protein